MIGLIYKDKVSLVPAEWFCIFTVEMFDDHYFMKQALVEAQKPMMRMKCLWGCGGDRQQNHCQSAQFDRAAE